MDPAEPQPSPKRNGWRSRQLRPVDDDDRAVTAAQPSTDDASGRLEDLYRSDWSGLVALAWSLTGDWAVAEELAQDAFADAYRRWDQVDRLERPGAWVRRAVINRSANTRRDRAADQRKADRLQATAPTGPGTRGLDPTGDQATDRVGDPAFWAAVRSLPDQQAACISLHYLEDRPVAEIAEIAGCRPATVKVHLHRARQTLARTLDDLTTSSTTIAPRFRSLSLSKRSPTSPVQSPPSTTAPAGAPLPEEDQR